ncbi:hypothetical protein CYY_005247 [Polysphondylium violaceum]|uniref:Complex 1 LYR protein domain-containing protein n=1 Tax=Polysphondylium violaceum TaxID=133409 RepID=A0A8J4PUJ9_9MYCE|nr:hypothetical protein CYY_005247 [Polysphondylium violaceum]
MSSRIIRENKKLVLNLYKRCLESAQRCPKFVNRIMMESYVRQKFRDNKDIDSRDFETIQSLLRQGEEELKSMNTYHDLRSRHLRGENTDDLYSDGYDNIENDSSISKPLN